MNSITNDAQNKLRSRKSEYERFVPEYGIIEADVPSLYRLIFDKVSPDTRVEIKLLKSELATTVARTYGNHVKNMLDDMDSKYTEILRCSDKDAVIGTSTYAKNLLDALAKVENDKFENFMDCLQDS